MRGKLSYMSSYVQNIKANQTRFLFQVIRTKHSSLGLCHMNAVIKFRLNTRKSSLKIRKSSRYIRKADQNSKYWWTVSKFFSSSSSQDLEETEARALIRTGVAPEEAHDWGSRNEKESASLNSSSTQNSRPLKPSRRGNFFPDCRSFDLKRTGEPFMLLLSFYPISSWPQSGHSHQNTWQCEVSKVFKFLAQRLIRVISKELEITKETTEREVLRKLIP